MVDLTSPEFNKQWNRVCRSSELTEIERFLSLGVPVDHPSLYGYTPFINAVGNGNWDIAKKLLARGANINVRGYEGMTALFRATRNFKLELVKCLLESGANPNIPNREGETPLYYAIDSRIPDKITDPNHPQARSKLYWSGMSIEQHNQTRQQMIKLLLSHGANPNFPTSEGITPFTLTCFHNDMDLMRDLLAAKADINTQIKSGDTVLMDAVYTGNPDRIQELLACKADPHIKNSKGETALDLATQFEFPDIIKLLS